MKPCRFSPLVALAACLSMGAGALSAEDNWPGFRGQGNSVTEHTDLPLKWSEDEGLAWSVDLEGYGQSSPVIWDGQVYVTSTGGDQKEKLFIEAFDLATGERRWMKAFAASQKAAEVSQMISRGAPTPVADAEGVYAFFESGDLIALDSEGELRWQRSLVDEFGPFVGNHGIGTSLVDAADSLVVLIDHSGPSYLLRVTKADGKEVWKTDRDPRVSWSTPLYLERDGKGELVVSSNGQVAGFDFASGEMRWWIEGVEKNTVASPTTDGTLVVMGSSEPQQSLAIRLGGEGDVRDSHVAWKAQSVTSSFGSPLIHGDSVFFVNRAGVLQSTNLGDGSLQWERRLPASTWASPLSAGERLYFFCNDGQTLVLPAEGDEVTEPLATNGLSVAEGDRLYGFAVAPGRIVMRLGERLVAAGE